MRKLTLLFSFTVLLIGFNFIDSIAQEKRAQTTMKFLSTSLDARAAGMADAHTAIQTGATAMFYNPSTMAQMPNKISATGGHLQWIADITYNSAGIAYRPSDGRYGVVGLNIATVDYGEFQETVIADNERGYLDLGTFSPTSISIGFSYAIALSSEFMIGTNLKYVSLDLANAVTGFGSSENDRYSRTEFRANTMAVDFGLLYNVGFESLKFAMSVRNFSPEVTFDEEATEIPLTFRIGISMDLLDLTTIDPDMHSLLLAVDANRPRDFYEQIMVGTEYTFMNRFSLRGGYVFPTDESNLSAGVGIRQPIGNGALHVDYSYTTFGIFENVQRLSVQFSF
ncbi:type IX secretion system outer membrane channel protein PorV [soil metagenome]